MAGGGRFEKGSEIERGRYLLLDEARGGERGAGLELAPVLGQDGGRDLVGVAARGAAGEHAGRGALEAPHVRFVVVVVVAAHAGALQTFQVDNSN